MQTGTAKRVMIFFDETDKWQGRNLMAALIDRLRREGCSGATVLRGTTGFGVHSMIHTVALVDAAIDLPVIIVVIDEVETIDRILPMVQEMVTEGLIVVDEVQALRQNKSDAKKSQHSAQQALVEHLVEEYMDRTTVTVGPETKVEEIIRMLVDNHRAHLPVINAEGNVIGMISSQDLLARIVHLPQGVFHFFSLHGKERQETGNELKELTAAQVMRTQFAAIEPSTSMIKAVQIMLHDKLSALPVVEGNRLVGILRLPEVLKTALSIECGNQK